MSMQIHIPDFILYEDDYLLVINKPSSLMVEPDRNNHPNLLDQVKGYLRSKTENPQEVYVQHIHRLDRPVSGIVLFTKDRSVLKNLSEQFAERKVKKLYQALTENSPDQETGELQHWHRKEKKKAALYPEQVQYSEYASLKYSIQKTETSNILWNIELHTGKFHQIRAQLASIGCPIIGDALYGSPISFYPNAIALHASELDITHPVTGSLLNFRSEPPFTK